MRSKRGQIDKGIWVYVACSAVALAVLWILPGEQRPLKVALELGLLAVAAVVGFVAWWRNRGRP